jgi:hypothetical protein
MKMTKKTFTYLLVLLLCSSFAHPTANDKSAARVNTYNGKQFFFWNEPTTQYEVAFTFQNVIYNYECANPSMIIQASLQNANAEAGNQNKLYDAIILGNGTARDMAIVWKDKSADNSIARVKRTEGYYVFVDCEPQNDYSISYKYAINSGCVGVQGSVDKLIKKATKKLKGKFDAVIVGSSRVDLAISFK